MDYRLIIGCFRLWRNHCPACDPGGTPCGICCNEPDCFTVLIRGKLVLWVRFKCELAIERACKEIDDAFQRAQKRNRTPE